jgi:TonB-dependent Receptor Plug Domain/CarboxypepD_reg-like domain
MYRLKTLLLFLITFQSIYSQRYTISGYIEDINTGERIIGAYVIDTINKSVTQTNNYGFYSLKIVNNKASLQATYLGLKSGVVQISLAHDTLINIQMQQVRELKEVIVSSSLYEQNENSPLGLTTISLKQLTSIPALGEPDLIKSIQSQPGIKGGIEGSAGIFVRGGGAGENLFMLDDVPIYNISHLYGFFSTFNSSAVKDIKLLKGCFPAQYGGRASSVVDVRSRDGNNKSIKGEISLGVISSQLSLEGPLFSDKTTFIISGRRSYFDLYSGILKKLSLLDKNFPGYYFYDLNVRITHTFSQNDKIFLSIYNGKDRIQNNNGANGINNNYEMFFSDINQTSGWGNFISSLRWNHTFGNSLFVNTTLAYTKYNYFTQDKYNNSTSDTALNKINDKSYSASYNSDVSDLIIKTDFEYSLSNNQKLSFGAGNTFHIFSPGKNIYSMYDPLLNEKLDTSYTNSIIHASEPFIYIEDEIKATQKLLINAGLRLSGLISESKASFNVEPRLSASYSILPQLVFKTGYSRMVQYIHLLSTSGLTVPTDLWVPALKGLQPLKSDQINAGIAFNWNKKALFSIEIYQKWLAKTTDYRNGASLLADFSPWYEKTTQGQGNAKGVEVSVEKQIGSFTGSINYTLSTTTRKYPDLNNGQTFPFMYDRLHDFNISVNFQISPKWDITALWLYGTGYPVTVPVEKYTPVLLSTSYTINYYPSLNNCRLPAYHRLDLGIHYKTHNRLGEHTISIDIFNAYDRQNPINVYYDYNNYSFIYTYLLPIIPSVTYTLKFK